MIVQTLLKRDIMLELHVFLNKVSNRDKKLMSVTYRKNTS
jgi:hypothetical protein